MTTTVRLIETTDQHLGITRLRCGRGFRYNTGRRKVSAPQTLRRIRTLAIPPMWEEVQIASRPDCHIQAVGRDAKGRKQYIYHEAWHLAQQQKKFERLAHFAQQLPQMRKVCRALLRKKQWTKEKVLALMVLILDETGIRIGNRQYLQQNNTYGLTTLCRKHLDVHGKGVSFHFTGKSNKELEVNIDDPVLAALVCKSASLPGHTIFRYQQEDGSWQDIDSDDVNTFIREHMGEEFSCKDFRTWVGTRLVIEVYPLALAEQRQNPRRKMLNLLVARIANELGNTVSVCRSYYIHPLLLELAEAGRLPVLSDAALRAHHGACGPGLSKVEKATLDVLKKLARA